MKYEQHHANEDGWSKWIKPVMKGYKLACCDCGLVHKVDFAVVKITKKKGDLKWSQPIKANSHEVEFRVRRDNRATAGVRRWKKSR